MYIAIGNFGNDSIALLQHLAEKGLAGQTTMVSIDTAWAAATWEARLRAGEIYAKKQGFQVVRLQSPLSFSEFVQDRNVFPNLKFQTCSPFLKGLPFNDFLDNDDPKAESCVVLAKRRLASRANIDLPETIEQSPHHGERKVWYPLYLHSQAERDALIERAGFAVLKHRSLECHPCIHSSFSDLAEMDAEAIAKTEQLEKAIGKSLFPARAYGGAEGIAKVCATVKYA